MSSFVSFTSSDGLRPVAHSRPMTVCIVKAGSYGTPDGMRANPPAVYVVFLENPSYDASDRFRSSGVESSLNCLEKQLRTIVGAVMHDVFFQCLTQVGADGEFAFKMSLCLSDDNGTATPVNV